MTFYEEIKTQRRSVGSQMPCVRWHWISQGQTASRTGSQNLSGTMREMRGQGTVVTKRVELAESNRVKRSKE
jgi:hypothetical protein